MSADSGRRPASLWPLVLLTSFSLMLCFASYGNPFPFMGTLYQGASAQRFVFGDSLISLYLLIGVLKRQRLTVWLLIGYNLVDICNAWVNLSLIPAAEYARLAGSPVPEGDLLSSTLLASIALILMNMYIFRMRREFDNPSPYLF
ncbi:hypothetical protein [Geomonas subterranea]|uniref:Uncharacterized protein n=1 Tax=Geomonas subterranea TaxID=2847989 RepID=A0ABX8LLJ0_9BACT|nr:MULTISPECIES: hypothetical protein [Geomonas]QXE92901.1 hypothetical protein KP001_10450 [Geomonas subterranea]QXM08994.1 hypothetical protein KP002_18825 [Geomonas subterranea]